jgi:broad specificity phosphatase PhoE
VTLVAERPPSVTHRLILVRHGEPVASAAGRCYGKLDVALSPAGVRQVEATAAALAAIRLDAVYASPRVRAAESAGVFARIHGLPVTCDARLAEIDFGELEGLTYDEAAARHPELYRAWMTRPTTVAFPGGESFAVMRRRVGGALDELRRRHRDQTIAVVAHGGVVRVALADALGMRDAEIFRLGQSYAGASCVDYYDDAPVVRVVNWTPLPGR